MELNPRSDMRSAIAKGTLIQPTKGEIHLGVGVGLWNPSGFRQSKREELGLNAKLQFANRKAVGAGMKVMASCQTVGVSVRERDVLLVDALKLGLAIQTWDMACHVGSGWTHQLKCGFLCYIFGESKLAGGYPQL